MMRICLAICNMIADWLPSQCQASQCASVRQAHLVHKLRLGFQLDVAHFWTHPNAHTKRKIIYFAIFFSFGQKSTFFKTQADFINQFPWKSSLAQFVTLVYKFVWKFVRNEKFKFSRRFVKLLGCNQKPHCGNRPNGDFLREFQSNFHFEKLLKF